MIFHSEPLVYQLSLEILYEIIMVGDLHATDLFPKKAMHPSLFFKVSFTRELSHIEAVDTHVSPLCFPLRTMQSSLHSVTSWFNRHVPMPAHSSMSPLIPNLSPGII